MWQFSQKNTKKIISASRATIATIIISLSPQFTHAWTEPTLTAPSGNLAAPINVGLTTQTKTGSLYVNGGVVTPLIWDTDNTLYYLNPFGASQISSIFANGGINVQGDTSLTFSDHNGGFNMTDNTWIRATGVGNIYAPGEMQATNIKANTNLCIGSDCRTAWPAASGLQLNTWQGNHYSGSDGAEYATIFYDADTSAYYVNPNGTSRMNTVNFTSMYGVNWAPGAPRWDFSAYVVEAQHFYGHDASQTMYLGESNPVLIRGDVRSPIFYDYNNTGYYVDPNSMSNLERVDFSYGYDRNNTGYYIDLDNRTNLLNLTANGDIRSPIFYDQNNTAYYVDPASTSRLNEVQADRVYGFSDIRSPIFYDYNNTGYYVDPASSSVLNNITANNVSAIIYYDQQDSNYYSRPANTSRLYNLVFTYASQASDMRLKEEIFPLTDSLASLEKINGVSFYWKDKSKSSRRNLGVIAQEVEKVFPELIATDPNTGMKAVQYGNLVAPLIEAVKELAHKIDDLFDKYLDQQKQIDNLRQNCELSNAEQQKQLDELKQTIEQLQKQIAFPPLQINF